MSGGHRPGQVSKAKVVSIVDNEVTFEFHDLEDAEYFIEGAEYVLVSTPAGGDSGGDAPAAPSGD